MSQWPVQVWVSSSNPEPPSWGVVVVYCNLVLEPPLICIQWWLL